MKIGIILLSRFNMMSLTTALEPFRVANYLLPNAYYDWEYLSVDSKKITASNQMSVECNLLSDNHQDYDLVMLFGSWGAQEHHDGYLYNWLRKAKRHGVLLCVFELGVYIFARAGLLKGEHITTHWSLVAGFLEQFPDLNLSEQLYTINDNLISCAGGAAGIDLMLNLIYKHHGSQIVSEIADQILHHQIRPANTMQRHTMGGTSSFIHDDIKATIQMIQDNISEPLKVPEIANRVGISQRQLERYCKRYMGCSVVQLSQFLRLQHARTLLISTHLSILDISVASGFNSSSHFTQAFQKYFHKKPSQYRNAWPQADKNPSWPGALFSFSHALNKSPEPKNSAHWPGNLFSFTSAHQESHQETKKFDD